MKTVYCKKGFDLKLIGKPSNQLESLPNPSRVALCPEQIPFIKPRLKVSVGEHVSIGSPLVEDKRNTDICLLSPGGGRIEDIRFGPRRVIQAIEIALDPKETWVEFDSFTTAQIEGMPRQKLVEAIVAGGLWPLIRQLPFRDYAALDVPPPAVYVVVGNTEPFHPSPEVYMEGHEELFQYGLTVLRRLAEDRLEVSVPETDANSPDVTRQSATLQYAGPYPAHDPGVLHYRNKTSADANRAWFVAAQDLLLLARLLRDGRYPTERVVSVAGSVADNPRHFVTRLGAPLSAMVSGDVADSSTRFIVGGVFTGYAGHRQDYLGMLQTAVNVLPSGDQKGELLGLFRPGYRKPTFSRAFLSAATKLDLVADCNFHGGQRACIACGYCTRVCPVDILPQFTYKALLAGEVEEALAHGLLDCVECGLCSFVCPSKIDLSESLQRAKADYQKEQTQDRQ